MSHLMQFQHVIVSERLAADIARVRFLASVGARVNLELLGTGESFVAALAHVRLLTGMRPQVDH